MGGLFTSSPKVTRQHSAYHICLLYHQKMPGCGWIKVSVKNVAGLGALNFDATDLPFPNWSDLYVRCQREKFTLGFYSTARDPRDKFHVCKNNDVFYEQPLSDVPYSYMCENGHFYQKGFTSFGCQKIWLQMPKSTKNRPVLHQIQHSSTMMELREVPTG